jgi:RNA polymerase sigma-70 factor (ECF subfamily)
MGRYPSDDRNEKNRRDGSEPSDANLLARVQAGDREAYLLLFDRYYASVEAFARKRLQNAAVACDIAAETFVRAYHSRDDFPSGRIHYLGYLLMICRRLVIAERARRGTTGVSPGWAAAHTKRLTDDLEPARAHSPLPLSHIAIQDALDLLPDADREILLLAYERHLSRNDIAFILGETDVRQVTTRLYRAMQTLEGLLSEQGRLPSPLLVTPDRPGTG